jgi:hypothetical protein
MLTLEGQGGAPYEIGSAPYEKGAKSRNRAEKRMRKILVYGSEVARFNYKS